MTYAGNADTALEPTSVSEKAKILAAIGRLARRAAARPAPKASGRPMRLRSRTLTASGVNRVILATDGDFNVGITSKDELKGFVERQREKGIFLSVLGVGASATTTTRSARRWRRTATASPPTSIRSTRRARCWSKRRVRRCSDRQGCENRDRVQSGDRRRDTGSSATRHDFSTRRFRKRQGRRRRRRFGANRDGALRRRACRRASRGRRSSIRCASPGERLPSPAEHAFVKIRYKLPRSDRSAPISHPRR